MNTRNDKMVELLAGDAPAARDLGFEVAVLQRIEQRRYRRGLAMNVVLTAAAALLLALVMPSLEQAWLQNLAGQFSNGMIAAVLFACILPLQWWMTRRV